MLVEKSLVLLVSCTEILQKLVSLLHDLLHSNILTLVPTTQTYLYNIKLTGDCKCAKMMLIFKAFLFYI